VKSKKISGGRSLKGGKAANQIRRTLSGTGVEKKRGGDLGNGELKKL